MKTNSRGFAIVELLAVSIILVIVSILGLAIYQQFDYGQRKGIVIDKKYHSAYITFTTSHVNGNTINIPVTHPENWSIKIEKERNGKMKTIWIDISETDYQKIKIEDMWE